ncbi:hypothetical protein RRG08_063554 [Elysia crispata]|uniref:Uncharacterized protein n=1 Tax=Elysia crispata TaxID=231223 RepID=A0AAE0YP30_9GAST|nr:hypothetical protein RRG08_063554 [Elysia crispata]
MTGRGSVGGQVSTYTTHRSWLRRKTNIAIRSHKLEEKRVVTSHRRGEYSRNVSQVTLTDKKKDDCSPQQMS